MSNFDYIMALNTIAGRSYNDLCQVCCHLNHLSITSILSIYMYVCVWFRSTLFSHGLSRTTAVPWSIYRTPPYTGTSLSRWERWIRIGRAQCLFLSLFLFLYFGITHHKAQYNWHNNAHFHSPVWTSFWSDFTLSKRTWLLVSLRSCMALITRQW